MSAVPQPTRYSERSVEAEHDLQDGRYWGIQAVLKRIDGRLVREEYYARLANHTVFGLPEWAVTYGHSVGSPQLLVIEVRGA